MKGEKSDLHDNYVPVLEEAEKQADDKRFFHWELEFPEVFVDLKQSKWLENPGFDAVVGNPPYVRMEEFKELKNYFRKVYEVYAERTDLYGYFIEKALELVAQKKQLGFIVSNKWMRANYGKPIQSLIEDSAAAKHIIDFGDLPVFNASTYPLILILSKYKDSKPDGISVQVPNLDFSDLDDFVNETSIPFSQDQLREMGWALLGNPGLGILSTIRKDATKLIDFIDSPPLMGVKTGLNEAFVVDDVTKEKLITQDSKSQELLYPLRTGRDVRRYAIADTNEYLIYAKHGIEIENYPAIKDYLSNYKSKLEGRATDQKWFELQQPQEAYEEKFKHPKIINPDLAERGRFYLDKDGIFTTNTAYFIPVADYYLLAILNLKLANFFLASTSAEYRGGYMRLFGQYVEELPIREIDFSKFNVDENSQYLEKLSDQFLQYFEEASADELLELTDELITDEDEYRLPVIHDFLADLAEKMLENNKEKQRLDNALDPFKFLNRGVEFNTFSDVFADAIKYGEQLTDGVDIGTVHHDIEKLRLKPDKSNGSTWLLSAQLKHRDPDTGWDDWIKEDEHTIRRTTHDIFQFEVSDEKARYWQQSFEVLDDFKNSGNFPGGKTRSTFEKLMKSKVPVFDENANIEPLIELREELAEVNEKIEKTDWLIDQVVYQLYGLSEDEIEIVEKSVSS